MSVINTKIEDFGWSEWAKFRESEFDKLYYQEYNSEYDFDIQEQLKNEKKVKILKEFLEN